MMKLMKILGSGLILAFFAVSASAETINSGATDVGSIDTVLGTNSDNLASLKESGATCDGLGGTALEECWAESVVGSDLDFDNVKTENVAWVDCDSGDCVAFSLQSGGGYYIVKNANFRLIVQNLADVDWGVIASAYTGSDMLNLGSDMQISHVTEYNGDTTVPEPGTLGLLGLGLLSLGVVRRRARKS